MSEQGSDVEEEALHRGKGRGWTRGRRIVDVNNIRIGPPPVATYVASTTTDSSTQKVTTIEWYFLIAYPNKKAEKKKHDKKCIKIQCIECRKNNSESTKN